MQRSLKYRILLGLCRLFRLQRVMELPPEKAPKLFRKAYKGVIIPEMHDEQIDMKDNIIITAVAVGTRGDVNEMQHKELFACHPKEWADEVFNCIFGVT